MTSTPQPEPCKHCGQLIDRSPKAGGDYLHIEGDQAGKHTCAIEPYGFHAEPVGTPCSTNPANPCNGAHIGLLARVLPPLSGTDATHAG